MKLLTHLWIAAHSPISLPHFSHKKKRTSSEIIATNFPQSLERATACGANSSEVDTGADGPSSTVRTKDFLEGETLDTRFPTVGVGLRLVADARPRLGERPFGGDGSRRRPTTLFSMMVVFGGICYGVTTFTLFWQTTMTQNING
jgi:hypothetical protein